MPKLSEELSQRECAALVRTGTPGRYAVGVPGLMLAVTGPGRARWVVRTRVDGRSVDRRIGEFAPIRSTPGCFTLADARDAAARARGELRSGIDPVEKRRAAAAEVKREAERLTFEQAARKTHAAIVPSLRNAKHAAQWITTLETYAFPTFGSMAVEDVTAALIRDALAPIWREKPETASRTLQRIGATLAFAEAEAGVRTASIPAARLLLNGKAGRTKRPAVRHHPALPVGAMPAFWRSLSAVEGLGARALQFAILTAARSGEVRGATWGEIDRTARTWTIPAERMKAGRVHVVPLSDAAMALLGEPGEPGDLLFPGRRKPRSRVVRPLSDMTLTAVCRRLGVEAVPHGFRSTFRDWCGETRVDRELAEHALAHLVGDDTERAYARGTMVEQRRPVMVAWGLYVASDEVPEH